MESFATKGGQFIVTGTVVDNDGNPFDETPVDIYINVTKEHGGLLLGNGETQDGTFQIQVQVPTNIPVGNYQVLAHAIPTGDYTDSWSDPPIVIGTETTTTLEGPDTVVVGGVASFDGSLEEKFGDPLTGQRMDLLIDDRLEAIAFTGTDGTFSFQHRFTDTGPAMVTVRFPGTDLYLPSQAEHSLRVVLRTSLTISAPRSAHMNQPVLFSGQLVDMFDRPVVSEEVLLSSAGQGELGRAVTDEEGDFALEHAFTRGGALTIRARFDGSDLYLPSSAETSIDVFIITVLTLEPPEDVDVEQPAVFSGTLTDTFDQGIAEQTISLSVDGQPVASADTDAEGRYEITVTFQEEGEYRLLAFFLGRGLYSPPRPRPRYESWCPRLSYWSCRSSAWCTTRQSLQASFRTSAETPRRDSRFPWKSTILSRSHSPPMIRATFAGEDFLRPAQVEETLRVITVDIETDVPPTLVRGETTTIGGRLTLADAPWTGETVTLLWDGQPMAEVLSQGDGTFSHELSVDPSESLDNHHLTVSVPSFQEETKVEVAVKARTSLSVAGPLEGHPDDSLTFEPTLLDDLGEPISQATILLDDHPVSAVTTNQGIATLSFQIPEEPEVERLSLAFRFEETDKYMGSLSLLGIDIVAAGGISPWIMASLVENLSLLQQAMDPSVQQLLASPQVQAILAYPVSAMQSPDPVVQQVLADPVIQQLLANPTTLQLLLNPAAQGVLGNPVVPQLLADSLVQQLLLDAESLQLVIDPRTMRLLGDPTALPVIQIPILIHRERVATGTDGDSISINEHVTTTVAGTDTELSAFPKSNVNLVVSRGDKLYLPGTEGGRTDGLALPFGVDKDAVYRTWVSAARQPLDTSYVSTERLDGLEVYVLKIDVEDLQLPALEGDPGSLVVDSNITIRVEPHSGRVVDVEDHATTVSLVSDTGRKSTLFVSDIEYTQETVDTQIEKAKENRKDLVFYGTSLPRLTIGLGTLLIVLGAFAFVQSRRTLVQSES